MSEMVERVARALAISDGYDPDDTTDVGFKIRNVAVWKAYKNLARAAIEAMREPTNAMLQADGIIRVGCEECDGHYAGWQRMIDAALD